MSLTLLSAIFSFVGCPGTTCDTGDSTCDSGVKDGDTDTDTDTDTDADADMTVTANWSASGLDLVITNADYSSWMLGMAESGAGAAGWFGESCISGAEPMGYDDYGYDYCHDGVSGTGIVLAKASPYNADNVVENSSTLFTDSLAGNITYVLATNDETGPCYVWGDDISYYSGFGCEAM